jgi:hypothetical protein
MNLEPWHDFFTLVGTAAATLLGLVFVAASIAATIPNEKLGNTGSGRLWVLPIVSAFVRVLVVSAMGVIPEQRATAFGYALLGLVLVDLVRLPWVVRGLRESHVNVERLSLKDWGWYLVYPVAATMSVAASALSLACGWSLPVHFLAAGLIGHLVIGVHNAWELAEWLATRQ